MSFSIFLLVLSTCCLVNSRSTVSTYETSSDDIGERDCCPLVWKKLIETPSGRIIPPDAVLIGDALGENRYYSTLPGKVFDKPSARIGIIYQDTSKEVSYFSDTSDNLLMYREGCLRYSNDNTCGTHPEEPIVVLTNPYACSLGWWKRTDDMVGRTAFLNPAESSDIHIPRIGNFFFAKFLDKLGNNNNGDHKRRNNHGFGGIFDRPRNEDKENMQQKKQVNVTEGGSIENPSRNWIRHDSLNSKKSVNATVNAEILYINCRDSMKNIMTAELFNITYDSSSLAPLEKEHQILRTTVVINNNELNQTFDVSLTADTTKSLQLVQNGWTFNSSQNTLTKSLNVGVTAGLSLGFMGIGLNFGGSVTTGYQDTWNNLMQKYAQSGQMTADTKTISFKFAQSIAVPPKSNTVINIVTTLIKAVIPYVAKYRIKPVVKGSMTAENTMNLLKRLGLTDVDKLVIENGEWVMSVNGSMSYESAYNTHVNVTSVPLDGNKENTVSQILHPFN